MKWSFFIGAVVLSWWLLLTHGAPLTSLAAGTGLAAFVTFWRRKG